MKVMSERNQLGLYMKGRFEKELKYALVFKLDESIRHIISDEYFDWCEKMLTEVKKQLKNPKEDYEKWTPKR